MKIKDSYGYVHNSGKEYKEWFLKQGSNMLTTYEFKTQTNPHAKQFINALISHVNDVIKDDWTLGFDHSMFLEDESMESQMPVVFYKKNKTMKTIKKFLLPLLGITIIFYLGGSAGSADFNIGHWLIELRITMACVWIAACVIVSTNLYKP